MRCCRCKQEKPIDQFNFKFKRIGIRQKACKSCTRREVKNHYIHNRQYYLHKAGERNAKIRKRNQLFIWKYLSNHFCVDCGEQDHIVLEFDHIRDKKFNIAFLIRDHSISELKEEILKCEVRCSNCHKRKTAKEFGWYKNIAPVA